MSHHTFALAEYDDDVLSPNIGDPSTPKSANAVTVHWDELTKPSSRPKSNSERPPPRPLASSSSSSFFTARTHFSASAMTVPVSISPEGSDAEGLAVIMLDLDHFKQINDHLGHAAGDRVLQQFAAVLSGHLRPGDCAARLGGEEFCAVMPGLEADQVKKIAEEIRTAFADLKQFEATGVVGVPFCRCCPITTA